jgi:predicted Zn-dependent protease
MPGRSEFMLLSANLPPSRGKIRNLLEDVCDDTFSGMKAPASLLKTSLFLTVIALVAACATTPTGRSQLSLLPESQMNQMGAQSFDEMKAKTPIEKDAKTNAYVKCIIRPLLEVAETDIPADKWEIVVFKDPTANAFALPGGKIGVHTGILPVAKTDAQLAAVVGHEIGHVMAHHSNSRVSQGLLAQGGLMVADLLSGSASPQKKQLLMAGLGLGAQFGVLLPFSRGDESEADVIGLDLMSKAGFDPNQSVELWKNMSASNSGKAPPEWMSTHPADATRIANLQKHIPEEMPKYQAARSAGRAPHCTL